MLKPMSLDSVSLHNKIPFGRFIHVFFIMKDTIYLKRAEYTEKSEKIPINKSSVDF